MGHGMILRATIERRIDADGYTIQVVRKDHRLDPGIHICKILSPLHYLPSGEQNNFDLTTANRIADILSENMELVVNAHRCGGMYAPEAKGEGDA